MGRSSRRPETEENLDLVVKTAWIVVEDDGWRDEAPCRAPHWPPSWFFPERGHSRSDETREALALCDRCPVRLECLADALVWNEVSYGIRGGHLGLGRKRIRRVIRGRLPEAPRTSTRSVLDLLASIAETPSPPRDDGRAPVGIEAYRRNAAADAMDASGPHERPTIPAAKATTPRPEPTPRPKTAAPNARPAPETEPPRPPKIGRPHRPISQPPTLADQGKPAPPRPVPEHGTVSRYRGSATREPCRCEPCREAMAAYNRARRERIGERDRGEHVARTPPSAANYRGGRCRCAQCTAAHNEYGRRWLAAGGPERSTVACGTLSSYKYGCRCNECRAAASEYNKQYLARRRGLDQQQETG